MTLPVLKHLVNTGENMIIYFVVIILSIFVYLHYFCEFNHEMILYALNKKKLAQNELNEFLIQVTNCELSEIFRKKNELARFIKAPTYKYFNEIIMQYLKMSKELGNYNREGLKDLRSEFQKDLRFEKIKTDDFQTGLFQVGLVYFLTWIFIFFGNHYLNYKVNDFLFVFIILWQVAGFFLYTVIFNIKFKKSFTQIEDVFGILYGLKTLLKSDLSCNEIFKRSNLIMLTKITNKKIAKEIEDLLNLCQKYKTQGINISEELDLIISEVWYKIEEEQKFFIKLMAPLRLFIILIFGLIPYFLNIMSIISTISL